MPDTKQNEETPAELQARLNQMKLQAQQACFVEIDDVLKRHKFQLVSAPTVGVAADGSLKIGSEIRLIEPGT